MKRCSFFKLKAVLITSLISLCLFSYPSVAQEVPEFKITKPRALKIVSEGYSNYYNAYIQNPDYRKNIQAWIVASLLLANKLEKSQGSSAQNNDSPSGLALIDVIGAVNQVPVREMIYKELSRDERVNLDNDLRRLRPETKEEDILSGNILEERYGALLDQYKTHGTEADLSSNSSGSSTP